MLNKIISNKGVPEWMGDFEMRISQLFFNLQKFSL